MVLTHSPTVNTPDEIVGGKSKTTETGICVPFIVCWKDKTEPGQTSNTLIDFTDIFPSFLDLAGVNPDKKWMADSLLHTIDGYSFKSVLPDSSSDSQREWILGMGGMNNARLTENGVENEYIFRDGVVRNAQFKLSINTDRKPERFIDLLNDPEESINLMDSLNTNKRKENFQTLSSIIESFPEKDSDPKYIPNPPQSRDVEINPRSQVWKK